MSYESHEPCVGCYSDPFSGSDVRMAMGRVCTSEELEKMRRDVTRRGKYAHLPGDNFLERFYKGIRYYIAVLRDE